MLSVSPATCPRETQWKRGAPHLSLRFTALALATASACLSLSAPAGARSPAPAGDEREAQRTDLYRQATKAAAAGDWLEAKERLRAAVALRSSPKVLFSLAQAEEQLGQLASAQADYTRALESGATDGKGDVVQAAELAQRALAPRVPHLRVLVSGLAAGSGPDANTSATLDDQPLALGATTAVDPGEHRLVVRARGMRTGTVTVKVSEGQQIDRVVTLVPVPVEEAGPSPAAIFPRAAPGAPPAPSHVTSAPSAPSSATPVGTTGLVVAGVGIIALGVGAVFGIESMSKHNDAEKVCPSSACATANGASLWHDAVTSGNASTIAVAVGGAALVAGTVLWLAAPKPSGGVSARVGLALTSLQLAGTW